MANEYDQFNEPATSDISLKDALYNILNGFQDKEKLRETGEGLTRLRQSLPGVAESVGRGAIAAVPGSIGDISEFGRTWAPEVMEKKFGKERFFPTTREILDYVPRMTPTHEGASTLEDVASLISPGIGGVTKDIAKLTKGVPIGATIQDVSKAVPIVKETEKLASEIDELGFHSPLENAILKIQQPKGTGEQFLKQLEKTPGVKTEELDVTGVKQYLLDHPNVTKQELLDHMKNSRLKLENKVLTKEEEITNNEADYELQGGDVYHDQDYIDSTAEDLHHQLSNDADIYHQEQEALVDRFPELYKGHENEPDVAARLNQHVEENIKELADTQAREMYYENPIRHYYDEHGYDIYGNDEMGYSVRGPHGEHVDIGDQYDISDVTHELRMHHLDNDVLDYTGNEEDFAKYSDYVLPGEHTNYREVLTTHQPTPAIVKELPNGAWTAQDAPNSPSNIGFTREDAIRAWRNEQKDFESSHYDEPNILAHTRLNDRTINGKKTLFVEEIQSDWHQAGRKKGYITPLNEQEAFDLSRQLDSLQKDKRLLAEKRDEAEGQGNLVQKLDYINQIDNISRKQHEITTKLNGNNGVPDAPFKKNWHELMMKQILNEAVKGNYDAVAFTTGKQQAERYSLSKQISKVNYSEGGVLRAYDKNGRMVISKKLDSPEQIEDYIGKEPAKKLMEQEVKPTFIGEKENGEKIAHGNPNVFDARELSGVDLDVGGEGMKGFYDKILPDFVNKYTKKWGMGVRKANTLPSLQGEQVHMVDLTDAAKKDIKEKGQPLFSGIGLAAPALMPEDQDKTKK